MISSPGKHEPSSWQQATEVARQAFFKRSLAILSFSDDYEEYDQEWREAMHEMDQIHCQRTRGRFLG